MADSSAASPAGGLMSLGLSLVEGGASRTIQRARAALANAEAETANKVRRARNEQAAAEGGLARWVQGENNKRRMRAAEQHFGAGQQNLVRAADAVARGSVEEQIAAAEAAGAYASHTALTGTGGASVDMIDMTARLRDARAGQARTTAQGYLRYDALQQLAGIMPQAVEGLAIPSGGESPLDYSVTLSQAQPVPGGFLTDLAKGLQAQPGLLSAFGEAPATRTPTAGDFARMDRGQGSWFNASESSVRLK